MPDGRLPKGNTSRAGRHPTRWVSVGVPYRLGIATATRSRQLRGAEVMMRPSGSASVRLEPWCKGAEAERMGRTPTHDFPAVVGVGAGGGP